MHWLKTKGNAGMQTQKVYTQQSNSLPYNCCTPLVTPSTVPKHLLCLAQIAIMHQSRRAKSRLYKETCIRMPIIILRPHQAVLSCAILEEGNGGGEGPVLSLCYLFAMASKLFLCLFHWGLVRSKQFQTIDIEVKALNSLAFQLLSYTFLPLNRRKAAGIAQEFFCWHVNM